MHAPISSTTRRVGFRAGAISLPPRPLCDRCWESARAWEGANCHGRNASGGRRRASYSVSIFYPIRIWTAGTRAQRQAEKAIRVTLAKPRGYDQQRTYHPFSPISLMDGQKQFASRTSHFSAMPFVLCLAAKVHPRGSRASRASSRACRRKAGPDRCHQRGLLILATSAVRIQG